jgi:hypothetical protein
VAGSVCECVRNLCAGAAKSRFRAGDAERERVRRRIYMIRCNAASRHVASCGESLSVQLTCGARRAAGDTRRATNGVTALKPDRLVNEWQRRIAPRVHAVWLPYLHASGVSGRMDRPSAGCGGGRGGTARLPQPRIAGLNESAHWQTIDLKPEPKHIMIVAGGGDADPRGDWPGRSTWPGLRQAWPRRVRVWARPGQGRGFQELPPEQATTRKSGPLAGGSEPGPCHSHGRGGRRGHGRPPGGQEQPLSLRLNSRWSTDRPACFLRERRIC